MSFPVTHFGKFYPPQMGGIETHLQQLCESLKYELPVRAVVAGVGLGRVDEVVNGVAVTRLSNYGHLASMPLVPGFFAEMTHVREGIVHVHVPNPIPTMATLACLNRTAKLVVTYHSDIVNQRALRYLIDPLVRRMLARADAIIATSPEYIESSSILRSFREKCAVIPLSVDVAARHRSVRGGAVDALRASALRPIVLTLGRLVPYKGIEYLIDAMSCVDAELWIAGEGPLRPALESRARFLGDRVRFLGRVEHAEEFYAASDVFVLPSVNRSEAFGMVQLEAMAFGKPVINTAINSGVPFASVDGVTGFTVPARDSSALGRAIHAILSDDELRTRLGAAAYARVRQLFDLPVMVESTLQLYRSLW